MTQPAPIISLKDVQYKWPGRDGGFSLSIDRFQVSRGETVLLLGDSGSGKSTLLSLICGTLVAHSGRVEVNATDLSGLSGAALDRFRGENIGVIFQQFNLLPFGSVQDNILLPLRFAPKRRNNVPNPGDKAQELCSSLQLPANILGQRAGQLSVGQQQRVAVARALIGNPPLIVADEPTSALDEGTQNAFLDLLFDQVRAQNGSLLMVSHDHRLAERFDRAVQLSEITQIEKAMA